MPSHATEIIPGLWIGNHIIANNYDFYKQKKISLVINCTKDLNFVSSEKHNSIQLRNIRIPVDDDLSSEQTDLLYKYLSKITLYIHQSLSKYKNILVHCYAGQQRSATVVCAYLMRYTKLPYKKVVSMIKSKRKQCFYPEINFEDALIKFEHEIKKI